MIEFRNVYKKFNNKCYIEDVSFTIKSKSILGIVGETGIGKTEILRMICGYTKPDSGDIYYDNYILGDDPNISISYLPEIDKMKGNLTVTEYLEFYCMLYGISKVETANRVTELIDFVELSEINDKQLHMLTRFEEIKLSLARCLINAPKVVLIDEPFNKLDMTSRSIIKNLIGDLNISGIAFVIVSHLLSEVIDFCSDIVLFNDHKVAVFGSIEYAMDVLNKNNPLKIEVLEKDTSLTYKTLTGSSIVSRVVKDKNVFYVYFNENDDKNVMQSRLLTMLVSQGIMPTVFARELRNNFNLREIYNEDNFSYEV